MSSTNLFVGGLPPDVTESELKKLLSEYGGVESVTCYGSRNYGFVNMSSNDDAIRSKDSLNGFVLRGNKLTIQFAKPSKPCKCLWVTGISKYVSKEALRDEFSKFGEIEEFKFQWEKNAAIVDYCRLEDATKAKEAMNGKKKRGTIMHVDYLRSQARKAALPSEGQTEDEQQSNILCISYPPVVHMDEQKLHNAMILFGEIEKITSFPSKLCSYVEFRSMEEANLAKERLQGKLFSDPRILITFSPNDPTANQTGGLQYQAPQLNVSGQLLVPNSFNGRAIPHGVVGIHTSIQPFAPQGGFDPSQIQREPKRLRTEGTMAYGEMNDRVLLANQITRGVPQVKGLVPSNTRFTNTSPDIIGSPTPDPDYIWRGIIAKGGNRICHARCVPVGDWIGYELPDIVNCSARTGLDMLEKHYADAIGFDIIYFLPDSEEDFASFTEFLRYMGDRNRAGVAKFDDGTTLFLVPPSDFLTRVLKVVGPPRLYGVVLKFPQHASEPAPGPRISQPQYTNELQAPPASNSLPMYYAPPATETPAIPAVDSLTPELLATLAALAKANSNGQQLSGNTAARPPLTSVAALTSLTSSSFPTSESVRSALPVQGTQPYQQDLHTVSGVTSSSQVRGTNVSEPQGMVPGQQSSEFDAEKNERYQSTLKFAASLLLQIQQKQHQ
ncbi:Nucleotide-binding, alpha-beta plait [Artemisia annua]|uniref:Nucleotide-binding, alpha-beta plait n=1 Tax=Artemisia annua TaxID=35608 RepID=A0A2U1L333_ARTAN|nr:Nucleotide-binding, alpha-beta plait [Artemisia annua]